MLVRETNCDSENKGHTLILLVTNLMIHAFGKEGHRLCVENSRWYKVARFAGKENSSMNRKKPLTVALISSIWLTGSMIFASGEAVIHFGAFGGILLSTSFLVALVVLCLFLRGVDGFVDLPLSPVWKRVMASLIRVMILELLITQAIVAGLIIRTLSYFSFEASVCLFHLLILGVVCLFRYASEEHLNRLAITKLIVLFMLAIFLPNYIFLQKGLETVYNNLLHYHPRVLHLEQTGILPFFLASSIIMFSKMTVYLPLLQKELDAERKRTLGKLGIAGLSWASIVIAFATMTIIGVTEKVGIAHVNELLLVLVGKVAPPFLYVFAATLMLFVIMVTFLSSLATSLSWTQLNNLKSSNRDFGLVVLMVLVSLLGSIAAVKLGLSVLDVFFGFGLISGPIGIVLIHGVRFRGNSSITWSFPIISLLLSAAIYASNPVIQTTKLVLVSVGSTAIMLSINLIVQKGNNSEKNSKN